jgi:hypothetical protein
VTNIPPTDIHKPFANATRASETTKTGKMEDIKTTRPSAAISSRCKIAKKLKKATGPERRLISQYVTTENSNVITTVESVSLQQDFTEKRNSNHNICYEERCWTVKTISAFFDHGCPIFEECRDIHDCLTIINEEVISSTMKLMKQLPKNNPLKTF